MKPDATEVVKGVPKTLTEENIDDAIARYVAAVKQMPLRIVANSHEQLFNKLKRLPVCSGPYPKMSWFEAANRVMTDLVILYGVRVLLRDRNLRLPYKRYEVEYGNQNRQNHDIEAHAPNRYLIGEAFNVAESFFQGKKAKTLRKLRQSAANSTDKIVLFNTEAASASYKPRPKSGELMVRVSISLDE